VLFRKRDEMLKQNPFLQGLSPLYRDYQPEFIFWEIPRFFCTVTLCGLVTVTNLQDGSQVATSLLVSTLMLVAYANCNPYLSPADEFLAQFCQFSLCLAMGVGLLEKSVTSEDAAEVQGSLMFGWILIACVTMNLLVSCGSILLDTFLTFFPGFAQKCLCFGLGSTTMDAIARSKRSKRHDHSKRQDSRRRRNSMPVSPEPLAVGNVTMVSRLADAEDPSLVQAWATSDIEVSKKEPTGSDLLSKRLSGPPSLRYNRSIEVEETALTSIVPLEASLDSAASDIAAADHRARKKLPRLKSSVSISSL